MCGITGFWDSTQRLTAEQMTALVQKMSQRLYHRGPDDGGSWCESAAGIALGHRRLSIQDLSPEGHQPMHSADQRYVMVFNGEIYNFAVLRQELTQLGHHFRGHSDTEVMLAGMSQWGVLESVRRFNGMFAFAVWDKQTRSLYLGRDRLGEKPLYYGWVGQTLLFASELKSLKIYPAFSGEIDRNALAAFLRYSYIPAPYSIYRGIYKLPPGTLLCWNRETTHAIPITYWSAKEVAEKGVTHPFSGTEKEAIAQLETLLREAIRLRMVADVPLGAFLSGGIDSSTIVALMQAESTRPVQTFTIGFHEVAYNEAVYAKAVAQHLNTDHTELYVTPKQTMSVIPKLPTLYDEPFADASQIPTFLVAQLARKHVTVCLSGDGGDELFAGYNSYLWGRKIWQTVSPIPPILRHMTASLLTAVNPSQWNSLFQTLNLLLPASSRRNNAGNDLHKLATVLAADSPEALHLGLASLWSGEAIALNGIEPTTALSDRQQWANISDITQRLMHLDTITYLPDDILTKVDRATMAVSLEARVPYLDHRVVEFAWQMPLSMKIRGVQGKLPLRQILEKYVPNPLIERPKMGFGIPIDSWLRGPLREWVEDLLDEKRLTQEGFLNPRPIRQKWESHLRGDRNWQYHLWAVLMFQAWLSENL